MSESKEREAKSCPPTKYLGHLDLLVGFVDGAAMQIARFRFEHTKANAVLFGGNSNENQQQPKNENNEIVQQQSFERKSATKRQTENPPVNEFPKPSKNMTCDTAIKQPEEQEASNHLLLVFVGIRVTQRSPDRCCRANLIVVIDQGLGIAVDHKVLGQLAHTFDAQQLGERERERGNQSMSAHILE